MRDGDGVDEFLIDSRWGPSMACPITQQIPGSGTHYLYPASARESYGRRNAIPRRMSVRCEGGRYSGSGRPRTVTTDLPGGVRRGENTTSSLRRLAFQPATCTHPLGGGYCRTGSQCFFGELLLRGPWNNGGAIYPFYDASVRIGLFVQQVTSRYNGRWDQERGWEDRTSSMVICWGGQ